VIVASFLSSTRDVVIAIITIVGAATPFVALAAAFVRRPKLEVIVHDWEPAGPVAWHFMSLHVRNAAAPRWFPLVSRDSALFCRATLEFWRDSFRSRSRHDGAHGRNRSRTSSCRTGEAGSTSSAASTSGAWGRPRSTTCVLPSLWRGPPVVPSVPAGSVIVRGRPRVGAAETAKTACDAVVEKPCKIGKHSSSLLQVCQLLSFEPRSERPRTPTRRERAVVAVRLFCDRRGGC
jgi:hypothetical protein